MTTETYVTRDGWPVADYRDHGGRVEAWFHREHPYSMAHALEHEGYAVVTVDSTSWQARHYDALMRPHTLTDGARVIVAMHDAVETAITMHERISDGVPGEWRDYLAGDTIGRIIAAAIEHLSYVDVGRLDQGTVCRWFELMAYRVGWDCDAGAYTGNAPAWQAGR